jgi:hypothetical protein
MTVLGVLDGMEEMSAGLLLDELNPEVLMELERAAEQQAAAGSAGPAAGQLLDGLPPEALRELERSAREAAADAAGSGFTSASAMLPAGPRSPPVARGTQLAGMSMAVRLPRSAATPPDSATRR